jgi:hypothetical protein
VTINVRTLITSLSAGHFLAVGLELAAAVGLPVTTWRTGDPTRSFYKFLAEALAARDGVVAEFIAGGFLSTAEGDWLEVLADEVYGVTKTQADFATPTITLRNDGGGYYDLAVGDLTVKSTESGVTFHSTSAPLISGVPGVLSAGVTATFELVADSEGSDGSVSIDELDELVTTLPGVVVVSSTAALANDAQSDEELRVVCRASRGALSPNGPRDAYEYVALNATLTGQTGITRARAVRVGATGLVDVYIAGPSGAVSGAAVTAVQDAIDRWATPLTSDGTVQSATALAITRTVTVNKSETNALSDAAIQTAIENALVALFAVTKIGGIDGGVSVSKQSKAVHDSVTDGFDSVDVGGAITLAATEVPVLAALTVVVQ